MSSNRAFRSPSSLARRAEDPEVFGFFFYGLSALAFSLSLIAPHVAHATDTTVTAANDEIAALMKITKIVGIFPTGPASEFKADEDPETLQILFLDKPEDGPSRVSDDGEVFFRQTDISQPDDQRLLNQAFTLRAALQGKKEP